MSATTYELGDLHGGLQLRAHKAASTNRPIIHAPVPARIYLPLSQHVGEEAVPIVDVGERVLRGQRVADTPGGSGAPVHASTSGSVIAIEPWPVIHRRGEPAPCIVIESDGRDEGAGTPEAPAGSLDLGPGELLSRILHAGIVGLGGAAFPTAQKLLQATGRLEHLLLNGVECEPYISCDDALMREHAREVVGGARFLLRALTLDSCIIAVEDDKPEAIRRLAKAIDDAGDDRLVLKQVPTIYPSGGEDQLVQLVTGREVPSGGLPADAGCLVQNVGTAAAVYRSLLTGEALISRITTVTGDGVASPVNVEARLGTPVADIISLAGGYTERATHLVIGGPMTGRSVSTDRVPVVKATNCILVLSAVPDGGDPLPCIRCGECAEVCPVRLLPQQLYWYERADDETRLRDYGLTDCIECGCCDLVCPSHIPLTAAFRRGKARIRELADEKARAERARRRFEARASRLQRDEEERERELGIRKAAARDSGSSAIAEILERSRRKDGD